MLKALQSWSQKKIGHIKTQLALAKEITHQLEIAQDSRPLSDSEKWLLFSLKKHSLALSSLQRTMARVRSRIGWLKEGDETLPCSTLKLDIARGKISSQN